MTTFFRILVSICISLTALQAIFAQEKKPAPSAKKPIPKAASTQFMGGPFRRGMDCDKQPPLAKRWPWPADFKQKVIDALSPQLDLLVKNPARVDQLKTAVSSQTNKNIKAELIRLKGTADLWHPVSKTHPMQDQKVLDGALANTSGALRDTCKAILLSPFDHVDMLKQIKSKENLAALLEDPEKTIASNKYPRLNRYLLKLTEPPLAWRSVPFEIGIAAGYAQPIIADSKVFFCTLGPKHYKPNTDTEKIQKAIDYAHAFMETVPKPLQERVIRKRSLNLANVYSDIITNEFSNIIGSPIKTYLARKWLKTLGELDEKQSTFIMDHLTKQVPTINIREALEADKKKLIDLIPKIEGDGDHYDWMEGAGLSDRVCLADFLEPDHTSDQLKVHCLDLATGKLQWTKTFLSIGKDTNGGCGTPAYWQGKLYIHTKAPENHNDYSILMCLDAVDGKLIWQTRLKQYHIEERGFLIIRDFPISNSSPLVYNGIICVQHRGLSGLDAKTGTILWQEPALGQQFSTPTAYTLDGEDYTLVRTRTTGERVRQWVGILGNQGMNQHLNHLPFKGGQPIDYLFNVHLKTGKVTWGISYQDNTRDYDTLTTWQTDQGVVTFDDFMRPILLTKEGPARHPQKDYKYIPESGMRIGMISDLRKGAELMHQYGGWGRDETVWWWMYYSLRLETFNKQAGKWELASQYQMPPVFAYPNPAFADGKCIIRMADGRLNCYDLRKPPSK